MNLSMIVIVSNNVRNIICFGTGVISHLFTVEVLNRKACKFYFFVLPGAVETKHNSHFSAATDSFV